jgi:ubiquinone/menaquinone biosynthesis C-methylase UbiE
MSTMGRRRVMGVAGLAGLAVTGVAVGRLVLRHRPHRAGDAADDARHGGWATCSAPNAAIYDRTFGWLLGDLYRRMAADVAGAVSELAAPAVLEIGPGPGGLAVELARRHAGLRLTGLDIDPAMVERAAVRARREGLEERLAFVVGDVASLPFPDASFDLVTSSFSVHHWPDAAAGFAEIRRVLRPGGRAIVYDLPDRWGRLETKAPPMGEVAAAGGFRDATAMPFAWPGRLAFVRRLEVVASTAG